MNNESLAVEIVAAAATMAARVLSSMI